MKNISPVRLTTPISEKDIISLKTGDIVYVSGRVYTARDNAHMRALKEKRFPANLKGYALFHAGPIVKEYVLGKWSIVCVGPTTSSRMNQVEPDFLDAFKPSIIIGKGGMDSKVTDALKRNNAAYLSMTGGCAASGSKQITRIKEVFWLDLGMPEAVWVFEVNELGPLVVAIDSRGNSLYQPTR